MPSTTPTAGFSASFSPIPALSPRSLAARAGVTAATCWRRLERLSAAGVIQGASRAVIDWRALGWAVEVGLRFTLDKTHPRAFDEFLDAARKVPEVVEIQAFLGRVDVRLNVIARDMGHYPGDLPRPHPDAAAYRRHRKPDARLHHQAHRESSVVSLPL